MKKAEVLIVDDGESLRRTLSLILGHRGYAVAAAKDGLEALEKFKEDHSDVILMDIKMPVMNGVDSCREIKRIRPDTAVIMIRAHGDEVLVEEAVQAGALKGMHKPLDMGSVLRLIDEVFM